MDAHVDGIIYTFLPSFPRLVEKIADTLPTVLIGEKQDELSVCSIELRNVAAGALLAEHLDTEERDLLPLAAAHLTPAQWAAVGAAGAASVPRSKLLLVFGMFLLFRPTTPCS